MKVAGTDDLLTFCFYSMPFRDDEASGDRFGRGICPRCRSFLADNNIRLRPYAKAAVTQDVRCWGEYFCFSSLSGRGQ